MIAAKTVTSCDGRMFTLHAVPRTIAPPGGNGMVNVDDLLAIINTWGQTGPTQGDIAPPGGNGIVNVDDLLAVINAWGPCR